MNLDVIKGIVITMIVCLVLLILNQFAGFEKTVLFALSMILIIQLFERWGL